MNAGFANLDTLKQHLLAPALRATLTYDTQIAALGLGLAAGIANVCQRKFARVAGDTETFPADRAEFVLTRAPVEAVTQAELKIKESDGWQVMDADFIRAIDLANGIVNIGNADAGPWYAQVRFTYTGGYWWNTLEPDDASYPETLPAGASPLPEDLRFAWLLQCKHVWQAIDPLGKKIVSDKEAAGPALADVDLIPQVKAMLQDFIRYKLV